jgi:hypothetical protein
MKYLNIKKLIISLLLGLFTVYGVVGVGILTFHTTGSPLGAIGYWGGECRVYESFAYEITEFYPETNIDEPYTGSSYSIDWNIPKSVVWVVIFSIIYWVIISLILRFRKKKLKEIR